MNEFGKIIEMPFERPIGKYGFGIVATYRKEIDDAVLKTLYEQYKGTGVSKAFVLSVPEFERFLREMLPVWQNAGKPMTNLDYVRTFDADDMAIFAIQPEHFIPNVYIKGFTSSIDGVKVWLNLEKGKGMD